MNMLTLSVSLSLSPQQVRMARALLPNNGTRPYSSLGYSSFKGGSHQDLKRDNSPLFGRDNRFFTCLSVCVDLSFGLLWDLKPIPGFDLASSTGSSNCALGFGLEGSVSDASCMPADLLDEEPKPSEWEGPNFWVERFEWRFDAIGFLPADFMWDVIPSLPSADPFSCTITPSLRLMSRKRFSQGRTAIHLSSQSQPQLLLSGSNPEGAANCLDPACHCRNGKMNFICMHVSSTNITKGMIICHSSRHKNRCGWCLSAHIKHSGQTSLIYTRCDL